MTLSNAASFAFFHRSYSFNPDVSLPSLLLLLVEKNPVLFAGRNFNAGCINVL